MSRVCALVVAAVGVGIIVGQPAFAQDTARYRAYVLESSPQAVVAAAAASGRTSAATTLHQRPARIHKLDWRAPYVSADTELADPVRDITFTFFNDALYQIVVNYDRERTKGLTNDDLIASVSATYGAPILKSSRSGTSRPAMAPAETLILAQWESEATALMLVRDVYSPDFRLILISKPLNDAARNAIREAVRLDAVEAPRRELEQRKKEVADATAARDKARTTNKAAFRP